MSAYVSEEWSGALNILITAQNGGEDMLEGVKPEVLDRHPGCYDESSSQCVYNINCEEQDSER